VPLPTVPAFSFPTRKIFILAHGFRPPSLRAQRSINRIAQSPENTFAQVTHVIVVEK
jgi:hypothetical protein